MSRKGVPVVIVTLVLIVTGIYGFISFKTNYPVVSGPQQQEQDGMETVEQALRNVLQGRR